ncbi:MAG: integrase family protein [Bacteroidetes bacterium]|nr:integrase family protein [Bacteroidota bacterium]
MARKIRLTPQRINSLAHPEKGKSFLWDEACPGLAVLASPKKKNYIYEGRVKGKTLRKTIGSVKSWTVEDARKKATEFRLMTNQGIDPRVEEKINSAKQEKKRIEANRKEITVADIWPIYLEERRPHWSERHYLDHTRVAHLGGAPKKHGNKKTVPGAMAELMPLRLSDLTSERVKKWISKESKVRGTQTLLAYRRLKCFLNWCNLNEKYKEIAPPDACDNKIHKSVLPKSKPKNDCLLKEQLPAWFKAVSAYKNSVISAYLQITLLTGARRDEILTLKWGDVDYKWKSLTISDKVEGERVIPLTPYVSSLLANLPRKNQWVFSSPSSATGRLQEPGRPHKAAIKIAGIEGLTIHGLRRSFGTLSEWVEIPTGIVYQIQGHKPSATAEKHYRVRPLDLLSKWHVKLEKWILEQAGIEQPSIDDVKPVTLKVVGGQDG